MMIHGDGKLDDAVGLGHQLFFCIGSLEEQHAFIVREIFNQFQILRDLTDQRPCFVVPSQLAKRQVTPVCSGDEAIGMLGEREAAAAE